MNEDQKAAQWAMFRIVQEVDKRLAGTFICFLYSTGTCQAVHHCEPEPCRVFEIDEDTAQPYVVAAALTDYIDSLSVPQMATGPDGRWVMHEGAK